MEWSDFHQSRRLCVWVLKGDPGADFADSGRYMYKNEKIVFPLYVQLGEPIKEKQGGHIMDFSTWSPSYTTIAVFVAVAFIGQIAVFLYCTGRLGKRLNKQSDDLRKLRNQLEDRIDKGIDDFNQPVVRMRKELSDVRIAISKLSQSDIEYLTTNRDRPELRKSHSTV